MYEDLPEMNGDRISIKKVMATIIWFFLRFLHCGRTGPQKEISRDLLMDFRIRKKESIQKVPACFLEEDRVNISIEIVNQYIE